MTFYINKASTNIVYPTLVEKTTINPVRYIWEVQDEEKLTKVYFTCLEESSEIQRYNQFTITEKAAPNPFSGEVELTGGTHEYKIYEISPTDLSNLSVIDESAVSSLTEVERGILKCIDGVPADTEYQDASITNTTYE